ncbi:MAG: hypothetical protein PHX64_04990 [Candidatus Omnitrophica bacterium]|nr:hypothetical protein [Candidatus Omnitrophota bacterium]MDD5311088.1 hypothetical protein [Candidatus Omnitrophota bacterium]MDD5546412.1 hypothetical protein [Candidatus Omnitrophota bacterium]
MEYVIILITLILAIVGIWFKNESSGNVNFIIILLLVTSTLLSIYLKYSDTKKYIYQKDSGRLTFRIRNNISYPTFSIGSAKLVKTGNDFVLFNILGDDLDVKIEKSYLFWKLFPRSQYKLNLTLRNEKNEILAKVKDNVWQRNPILTLDKNFTKDALEILDKEGNVILRVRILGDVLDFSGRFYSDTGDGIALCESVEPKGGLMEIKHNGEKLEARIKPIFKYPSAEYPGVLEKH